MKNLLKKCKLVKWAKVILLTLLTSAFTPSNEPTAPLSNPCDAPVNIVKTIHTESTIAFTWGSSGDEHSYEVRYVRIEDGFTSSLVTGTNFVSFTGLPAGTYKFYFSTICGFGTSKEIVIDDLMMG
ncbi:MAG: fibronectin type III domain-containing protein [Bacteroidota bacterium]